jgi:SRSO17 transposase
MHDLDGLLRPAARKHSGQLADIGGAPTPSGFQSWRGRADGDAEASRAALCPDVRHQLGDPNGVLVLDATSFVKQGCHAAGVARPYTGTVGQVGLDDYAVRSWTGG